MQIPPSPALAHLIKHFLIIENDYGAPARLRMFSDGNPGIVFPLDSFSKPLGGSYISHQPPEWGFTSYMINSIRPFRGLGENFPECFLYGQIDDFKDIVSAGKISILIAVFHPFGLSSLLRVQAIDLRNQILDLETFYAYETDLLLDQIFQTPDILLKIKLIEKFLLGKIAIRKQSSVHAVHAVRLIRQHNGNLSVAKLSSLLQISGRKLQRTFQEHIGYSPKRLAGITRVQYFLKLLRSDPESIQTRLVYDAGFFDQAHLIREMKNISGMTPGEYIRQPNLLAANFLQIP